MPVQTTTDFRPPGLRTGSRDDSGGWRDGDHREGFGKPLPIGTGRLGMWLALASISMLFIGLTSAYVVRQGLDPGWRAIRMPVLLLLNTAVLLASTFTMEKAKRALRPRQGGAVRDCSTAFRPWLTATMVLAALFLAGQLTAWQQLSARGIYLNTQPHASFFFLLTGLHGLHLLGGLLALAYVSLTVWTGDGLLARAGFGLPDQEFLRTRLERWVEVTALYWHFMGGLWIYLLLLLFGWR